MIESPTIIMKKRGGSPSRKFSRFLGEEYDEFSVDIPPPPPPPSPDRSNKKSTKYSPNRGKRILQSVGCVSGSPKRTPLEDDDDSDLCDSPSRVVMGSRANGESQKWASRALPQTATANDRDSAASFRQRQVEQAIQTAISSESVATRQYDDAVASVPLKMQPSYDDAHVVFQSPGSDDAGTDISRGQKWKNEFALPRETNVRPSPAQPVVDRDDDDDAEAITDLPDPSPRHLDVPMGSSGNSSAPTGVSYNHVEALIARVKRLDAVVKAGEKEEAALLSDGKVAKLESADSSTVKPSNEMKVNHAPDSTANPGAEMKAQNSTAEQDITRSPAIKPIQSSLLDSPPRLRKTGVWGAPTGSEAKTDAVDHERPIRQRNAIDLDARSVRDARKEVIDDGAQDFQVIYRRGRDCDSPACSSQIRTSVAPSSVVTVSSFGIPGVPVIQKPLPIVTPPIQKSRSTKQVTAHAFFWRTHPKDIFTSYGPNRPKTILAPLRGKNSQVMVNPPGSFNRKFTTNSLTTLRSSRMRTVKEGGEHKYETRDMEANRDTFSSMEKDPDVDSSEFQDTMQQHDGTAAFSPYGEETGSTRRSAQAIHTSPSNSSDRHSSTSNTWVVFSEFSVCSDEDFR